jgi:hypothetical protein
MGMVDTDAVNARVAELVRDERSESTEQPVRQGRPAHAQHTHQSQRIAPGRLAGRHDERDRHRWYVELERVSLALMGSAGSQQIDRHLP